MAENPNPKWKQDACEWCAKGVPQCHVGGMPSDRYFHALPGRAAVSTSCTAPTEAQYIEQLTARVAELREAERETADQRDMEHSRRTEVERDLEEARAENARLRTALKPFASFGRFVSADDEGTLFAQAGEGYRVRLTASHFRDALAALSSEAVAAEVMYYIQNVGCVGNCLLWWRKEGNGYTCDLSEAWLVTNEKAKSICKDRPNEDIPYRADLVDGLAKRHVDSYSLGRGSRRRHARSQAVTEQERKDAISLLADKVMKFKGGNNITRDFLFSKWNPFENQAHAGELVEAMFRLGFMVSTIGDEYGYRVLVNAKHLGASSHQATFAGAIATAIHRLVVELPELFTEGK